MQSDLTLEGAVTVGDVEPPTPDLFTGDTGSSVLKLSAALVNIGAVTVGQFHSNSVETPIFFHFKMYTKQKPMIAKLNKLPHNSMHKDDFGNVVTFFSEHTRS